jgi:hypothetical protein
MFNRVPRRYIGGPRGEGVALLKEYQEAASMAQGTLGFDTEMFLPETWDNRMDAFLEGEKSGNQD